MLSALGNLSAMAGILWQPISGHGAERTVVDTTADGNRIAGTTLLALDGAPYEIRFSVLTGRAWRTHTVGAHVQGPDNDRRLALHCDRNGTWSVGEEPILDLFGATDIDLAWTPATTVIAINRLALDVGESAEIVAALVSFPEHAVRRQAQRYERLSDTTYRYIGRGMDVELTVDATGLVVDHPGGWRAVTNG